ncbi:hypothetical protein ACFPM3_18055 [Streptomyces coeruleoprunus]|uniref:SMODS and SLOG-associating 2TM effector domain-containing protein n=1 Tax=Streptomyces coeruleoprunus TaxID=285563 RepID=A0ABV9XGB4_9ACTN
MPVRAALLMTYAEIYANALRLESQRLRALAGWFGYPVIMLSAATGGALFAELAEQGGGWKLATGIVLTVSAALAAVEKAGQFAERSRAAGLSASEFGDVFGALIDVVDHVQRGQPLADDIVQKVYDRYFEAAKNRPALPARRLKVAQRRITEGRSIVVSLWPVWLTPMPPGMAAPPTGVPPGGTPASPRRWQLLLYFVTVMVAGRGRGAAGERRRPGQRAGV